MSDILTRFDWNGEDVTVERVQDVEPILEHAQELAKQPNPKGDRMWHKWSLPNVIIEQLYLRYAEGELKPLDQEFWKWVDKTIMTDADYAKFRTANSANQFFMGYGS